jgi:hypothetical protein
MMHVPLALALLAALIAVSVILRFRWPGLSRRMRTVLVGLACGASLLEILMRVSKWGPNSDLVFRLIGWATVAAYVFLVILWTRVAPRWLTTICAIIFLLPLAAPTLLFPLAGLFNASPPLDVALSDSLFSESTEWRAVYGGTSGIDFEIYYRPERAPFLRRSIREVRLYNGQCNTSEVSAALSADHEHVLVSCPPWPGKPTEQSYDVVMPLR